MKRESLKRTYEGYVKHYEILQCIGDDPRILEKRKKREERMRRVGKIISLSDACESPAEFLTDIALAKEIVERAMSAEEFT